MRNLEQHYPGGACLAQELTPAPTVPASVPSISNGDGMVAVLVHGLRQWARTWMENHHKRANLWAIAELDDRMLGDIGLERQEVAAAAAQSDPHRAMEQLKQIRFERIHGVKNRKIG
ncbi:MAG: DUF1127 domain-containing protein [Pseudomonadota bacterium]